MEGDKKGSSVALTKGSHNIHQSVASAALVVSSSCLKAGHSKPFFGIKHTLAHNDFYFKKVEVTYPYDKEVAVCQGCEQLARDVRVS